MHSPARKSGTLPVRAGMSESDGDQRVKSASSKRRVIKTQSAAKTTTGGAMSHTDLMSDAKSLRKGSQAKGMIYTDTDGISNTIDEVEDAIDDEHKFSGQPKK